MLLRQAKAEGTVMYLSNLFDTFFEGGKDHRVDKPSVLHLPYFEGVTTPQQSPVHILYVTTGALESSGHCGETSNVSVR